MSEKPKITIKKISQGEETVKLVESSACVSAVAPSDGFVITSDIPLSGPIFIRISDLEKAEQARAHVGKMVTVPVQGWDKNKDKGDE